MIFTVFVHEAEEGGFWGECLELPGCASQGETLDEMDRNIREAIEGVLEVKLEDGEDLSVVPAREPEAIPPDVREWRLFVSLPVGASA